MGQFLKMPVLMCDRQDIHTKGRSYSWVRGVAAPGSRNREEAAKQA